MSLRKVLIVSLILTIISELVSSEDSFPKFPRLSNSPKAKVRPPRPPTGQRPRPHRPSPQNPKHKFTPHQDFLYTAIFPKLIRPHHPLKLIVSLEKATGPVDFDIILKTIKEDNNYNYWNPQPAKPVKEPVTISKAHAQLNPETSTVILVPLESLGEDLYNVTLKATNTQSGKNSVDCGTVYVDSKDYFIIVQTDKPIYKPGEEVHFRILFVDRFLKPVKSNGILQKHKVIKIEVFDAQRNIVKSWMLKLNNKEKDVNNINLEKLKKFGFIKESLGLSKEPNLGEWSIEISTISSKSEEKTDSDPDSNTGDQEERQTHTFSVDQYILPKFMVELKTTPKFVTYNDSKFSVEVKSTYTHAKGVKGLCTLTLKPQYYNEYEYLPTITTIDSSGHEAQTTEPKRQRSVSRMLELDGKDSIDFDLKSDLHIRPTDATDYGMDYIIEASCTEQVSSKVQNATVDIKLYSHHFKIEVAEQPANYKPGFNLTIVIKVSTHDDLPIEDEDPEALKIEHGFSYNVEGAVIYTSIPTNGLVPLYFTPPTNELLNVNGMEVTYKGFKQYLGVPHRMMSNTKSYMMLTLQNKKKMFNLGDTVEVLVEINKPFDSLNYILWAKGRVVKWERVGFGQEGKEQKIRINLGHDLGDGEIKLLTYTVLEQEDDVIADSIKIEVKNAKGNVINIDLLDNNPKSVSSKNGNETLLVGPGANITIKCEGSPNSLFALRGVDQSVLLLKEDKDITPQSIKGIEQDFENAVTSMRNWGGSDTFQIFETLGLNIMTNAQLTKNEYPVYYNRHSFRGRGVGFAAGAPMAMEAAPASRMMMKMSVNNNNGMMGDSDSSGFNGGQPIRLRKSFPETWIFTELESGSGTINLDKMVPDTITSWIISAYQISPDLGLGLTCNRKLTVFRPFFIALNLPYSVVKGEVFNLQVLVHNYMDTDTEAKVTLDNAEKTFEFIQNEDTPISGSGDTKSITVESQSVGVLTFLITPVKIGTITLNLKALTSNAGDALSQSLIVKPPGVKQSKNNAIFINLLKDQETLKNLSAILPDPRVPDGDTLKVTVIGDILGGTMNNLDQLIQLPYGCGEQNMLNFVPDIVILDYLKATDSLTQEIKQKALRFLETGYQRELTFKRYDGSFSAFGNSDEFGSTWLTAFVVRSFISARRYITIEDSVLNQALEFLTRQQSENGSFLENGMIHDIILQGGAGSRYALTAFTLMTYLDAKTHLAAKSNNNYYTPSINYSQVIDQGVGWILKQHSISPIGDTYSIIMITYLLHLLDHPQKEDFFKLMEEHAITDPRSDFKYWQSALEHHHEKDGGLTPPIYFYWSPWYNIKPASVEMTAYALLTYLIREKGEIKESISIARWLMKQRNCNGGFLSTQDTVVGINALAKFAEQTRTPDYEMSVQIQWGTADDFTFYIGKDNTTTLQEYFLPMDVRNVDVKAKGKGTALAQLSWTYYTMNSGNYSGFSLDIIVNPMDKNRRLEYSICSSYTLGDKSNMVILEVNTPTGYSFDPEELTELSKNPEVKRHESEDGNSRLNIYFNSLTSKKTCVELKAHRIHLVAKHSKSSVQIYDYYDTTRKVQKFYDGPEVDVCQICQLDSSCKINKCG